MSARASFEMALLVHGTPNGREISRWDAPTGRYMGSFGRGSLSALVGLAADPSRPGTVITGHQTSSALAIRRFDYSTGDDLGFSSFSTISDGPGAFAVAPNGHFAFAVASGATRRIRVYDPNFSGTRLINIANASTSTFLSIAFGADGSIFSLLRRPGSSSGFRYSLLSWTSLNAANSDVTIADNVASSNAFTNLFVRNGELIVGGRATTDSRSYVLSGSTIGSFRTFDGFVGMSDVVLPGHGDRLHSFGYNSGQSRMELLRGNSFVNSWENFQFIGGAPANNSQILGGTMVLAPEPGTMIALGAGLAAFVVRRRKKQ